MSQNNNNENAGEDKFAELRAKTSGFNTATQDAADTTGSAARDAREIQAQKEQKEKQVNKGEVKQVSTKENVKEKEVLKNKEY